jgi:hypothetical protein
MIMSVDPFGGPAISAEPQQRVIGKRQFGWAVDRHRVVVIEDDQLFEPEMTGQ